MTESRWLWPKCLPPFPGPVPPLGVCDLENSDPLRSALDGDSGWRQGSSWGLPAPRGWPAGRHIPGRDARAVVRHMCGESCPRTAHTQACPHPPHEPPGGLPRLCSGTLANGGVLPAVPAVAVVQGGHGGGKSLPVDRGSCVCPVPLLPVLLWVGTTAARPGAVASEGPSTVEGPVQTLALGEGECV